MKIVYLLYSLLKKIQEWIAVIRDELKVFASPTHPAPPTR